MKEYSTCFKRPAISPLANPTPPYKIEKVGEDRYRIEIAAAGFALDDLIVRVASNLLTLSGILSTDQNGTVDLPATGTRESVVFPTSGVKSVRVYTSNHCAPFDPVKLGAMLNCG